MVNSQIQTCLRYTDSGSVVQLQYCSQASAHNLSSIPTDSGSWLKLDSTFRLVDVGKMSTQLAWGWWQSVVFIIMLQTPQRVLWSGLWVKTTNKNIFSPFSVAQSTWGVVGLQYKDCVGLHDKGSLYWLQSLNGSFKATLLSRCNSTPPVLK